MKLTTNEESIDAGLIRRLTFINDEVTPVPGLGAGDEREHDDRYFKYLIELMYSGGPDGYAKNIINYFKRKFDVDVEQVVIDEFLDSKEFSNESIFNRTDDPYYFPVWFTRFKIDGLWYRYMFDLRYYRGGF